MVFEYLTPSIYKDSTLWYISLWLLTAIIGGLFVAFIHPLVIYLTTRVITHVLDAIVKALEVAFFIVEQVFNLPFRLFWTVFHSIYPKKNRLDPIVQLLYKYSVNEDIRKIIDSQYDTVGMTSKELSVLIHHLDYYDKNHEILKPLGPPSEDYLIGKSETYFDQMGDFILSPEKQP